VIDWSDGRSEPTDGPFVLQIDARAGCAAELVDHAFERARIATGQDHLRARAMDRSGNFSADPAQANNEDTGTLQP
jgi:hypothetical protein